MKKTTIFIIILISLVLIIGLPLAIDWLIIGNGFPSNIENSDWVSFFGGYIGALIGAIVSLAGIISTIRYTNRIKKIENCKLGLIVQCVLFMTIS